MHQICNNEYYSMRFLLTSESISSFLFPASSGSPRPLCTLPLFKTFVKIDGIYSSHSFPLSPLIMQRRQLMRHIRLSNWETSVQLHKRAVTEEVWQACLWTRCSTHPQSRHLHSGVRHYPQSTWTHHSPWLCGYSFTDGLVRLGRFWYDSQRFLLYL